MEFKVLALEKDKNWKAFNVILSLFIYGIVLFPSIDDFVDIPAINVFQAKKHVPALLADAYY